MLCHEADLRAIFFSRVVVRLGRMAQNWVLDFDCGIRLSDRGLSGMEIMKSGQGWEPGASRQTLV